MQDEYEIIDHSLMEYFNLFLVEIDYRNAHLHQDFELDYLLSGEISLITHNRTDVLGPGELILINPNVVHEIQTGHGNATILCLQLSPKFLRQMIPGLGYLSFEEMILQNSLDPKQAADIRALLIETAYQRFLRQPAWQLLCSSFLSYLLFMLLRHVPFHNLTDEERDSIRRRVERLGRIVNCVEENYMRKILLNDIAINEHVTAGYLSHFIKDNLNQSFQDYVNSVRLQHAKALLRSDKHMIDICLETGFSDPRYLRKALLKHEGCTPAEYRRRSYVEEKRIRQNTLTAEYFLSDESALEILGTRRREWTGFFGGIANKP